MVLCGGCGSQPRVGVRELRQREAAIGGGVGHLFEVTVEGLESEIAGGRGGCSRRCMECERVRRAKGAWRCSGGGDAVDGGGGCSAAKDVSSLPYCSLIALERELM